MSKLKDLTLKKKIQYFWDYYRTSTIIFIVVILVATSIIKTISANKVNYDTYCLILNDSNNDKLVERIKKGYPDYQGNRELRINVDNGYTFNYLEEYGINWPEESAIVKLFALKEDQADAAIADYNTMLWAVYENYIYPLDEILPNDLLEQLKPYYIYASFKGEEESDGKIYGFDISDTKVFKGYSEKYQKAVVFIPNLTTGSDKENRLEKSIEFIKYLFDM
ncbi:hypothetical protein [Lachnoclostridium phytofermentans]|uniref:Uncharacterized protein n=1 Tax=Lachnoclostridium phytofermentans (strain ATCC 700394 / DSM 18823 / ISDg) TaxID=357809 RepID=A9KSZ2_LACP7|nr:hypothetical protein [Lachnoclostridium phytofermentans]ABX42203.1 hypothetical protein Cphy_1834 [Lachnoclostridium phytofermentans ISDg]